MAKGEIRDPREHYRNLKSINISAGEGAEEAHRHFQRRWDNIAMQVARKIEAVERKGFRVLVPGVEEIRVTDFTREKKPIQIQTSEELEKQMPELVQRLEELFQKRKKKDQAYRYLTMERNLDPETARYVLQFSSYGEPNGYYNHAERRISINARSLSSEKGEVWRETNAEIADTILHELLHHTLSTHWMKYEPYASALEKMRQPEEERPELTQEEKNFLRAAATANAALVHLWANGKIDPRLQSKREILKNAASWAGFVSPTMFLGPFGPLIFLITASLYPSGKIIQRKRYKVPREVIEREGFTGGEFLADLEKLVEDGRLKSIDDVLELLKLSHVSPEQLFMAQQKIGISGLNRIHRDITTKRFRKLRVKKAKFREPEQLAAPVGLTLETEKERQRLIEEIGREISPEIEQRLDEKMSQNQREGRDPHEGIRELLGETWEKIQRLAELSAASTQHLEELKKRRAEIEEPYVELLRQGQREKAIEEFTRDYLKDAYEDMVSDHREIDFYVENAMERQKTRLIVRDQDYGTIDLYDIAKKRAEEEIRRLEQKHGLA